MRKTISTTITVLLCIGILLCGCTAKETAPAPVNRGVDINTSYVVDPVKVSPDGELEYEGINPYIADIDYGLPEKINVPDGRDVKDVVGAVTWGGRYNFTDMPYLLEGGNMVAKDLGTSVIKTSLSSGSLQDYAVNADLSDWAPGTIKSMEDLAKSNQFQQFFGTPGLKTFIMSAREFSDCPWLSVINISNGEYGSMTQQELENIWYPKVEQEFYDVTKYLLSHYAEEEKTFILSTWEGDGAVAPAVDAVAQFAPKSEVIERQNAVFRSYAGYLNARQDGINAAREEFLAYCAENGITPKSKVYGCAEGNNLYPLKLFSIQRRNIVFTVFPMTHSDLYSISNYDSQFYNFDEAWDMIMDYVPNPNPDFAGKKNIIMGEFGYPEGLGLPDDCMRITRNKMIEAVEWGAQYVTYWAYQCNETRSPSNSSRPENQNMNGFWMIRPDGSFSPMFWYVKGLCENKNYLSNPPKIRIKTPKLSAPVTWKTDEIVFEDDLSYTTDIAKLTEKMSGHSEVATGIDNPNGPTGGTYGINFCDLSTGDKAYFDRFTKYYDNPDFCGFNRYFAEPTDAFISYEVRSKYFAFFEYNYGPASGTTRIMGKINGEWEIVDGVAYQEYRVGSWGQSYISVQLQKEYTEVKIVLSGNTLWDPIVTSVYFLDDGVCGLPKIPVNELFPDHPQNA